MGLSSAEDPTPSYKVGPVPIPSLDSPQELPYHRTFQQKEAPLLCEESQGALCSPLSCGYPFRVLTRTGKRKVGCPKGCECGCLQLHRGLVHSVPCNSSSLWILT